LYAVIFAADVRTTFDEFRKTMVATAIAKTVITVNPGNYEQLVSQSLQMSAICKNLMLKGDTVHLCIAFKGVFRCSVTGNLLVSNSVIRPTACCMVKSMYHILYMHIFVGLMSTNLGRYADIGISLVYLLHK